jgi:hypothetical protein
MILIDKFWHKSELKNWNNQICPRHIWLGTWIWFRSFHLQPPFKNKKPSNSRSLVTKWVMVMLNQIFAKYYQSCWIFQPFWFFKEKFFVWKMCLPQWTTTKKNPKTFIVAINGTYAKLLKIKSIQHLKFATVVILEVARCAHRFKISFKNLIFNALVESQILTL